MTKMSPPKTRPDGGEASCIKPELSKISGIKEEDSPPGSRTPRSPRSDGSPVSDDTCPICLGHITDKCVTNSCFHYFCLVCLKEWAKQKPVCPLCKLRFTTIMYDIKSETEYKEYVVPRPEPPERSQGVVNFQEFLDAERRRFFGYRTTNFPGAAALRRLHGGRPQTIPDSIPSGPRERRSARYNVRGSSMFRLSVYENNVWVQPIADITGRYRQSGPDLYREQPALTHRLVPWVNRELAALLPTSRIGVVLTEVMDLIERYPIDSPEFRRTMLPHLGARTNHFVHEFYHFARSPYDMVGHDNAAQYTARFGFPDDISSSSSEDSDAVVEVDARGNPILSTNHGTADPQRIEREEILTQEGSVVISSDEGSSADSSEQANQFMWQPVESIGVSDLSATHNPEPPPSVNSMRRLLNRARNFLSIVNEGASTSRSDENSETTHGETSTHPALKREAASDSDDSDACIIVDEVNKKQTTPEIIDLDSDDESAPENSSHWKTKVSGNKGKRKVGASTSHTKKERIGKQKPSLKRNNFTSIDQSGSSGSSSSNKRSSEGDHSYCSERRSAEFEASASTSSCHGSGQTSSIEISLKWHNHHERHESVVSVRKKEKHSRSHRNRIISSDSDGDSNGNESQVMRHSNYEKVKYKNKYNKSNSSDKARENDCGSSSQHREKSPVRNSLSTRAKKDHRSKVKSSSKPTIRREHHSKYISDVQTQETNHIHFNNSETSSTSPSSSTQTERSASWDEWYPDSTYSTDSALDSRSSSRREHRENREHRETRSSKSRHSSRKSRHRKKSQCRSEKRKKSKKSKKTKHKKKSKTKKLDHSSDSDSDSSYNLVHKKSRKKRCIVESSTSDTNDSSELETRRKPKKARKLSESSSSAY